MSISFMVSATFTSAPVTGEPSGLVSRAVKMASLLGAGCAGSSLRSIFMADVAAGPAAVGLAAGATPLEFVALGLLSGALDLEQARVRVMRAKVKTRSIRVLMSAPMMCASNQSSLRD